MGFGGAGAGGAGDEEENPAGGAAEGAALPMPDILAGATLLGSEASRNLERQLEEEFKIKCDTEQIRRIVKACQEQASKMENTPVHMFEKAVQTGGTLFSLLVCWNNAPADKKDSCGRLIDWIRKV